jgi:hypothetical protein
MEDEIPEPHLTTLVELVMAICTELLPQLRRKCKEVIPSVDANLIKSCLNLLQTFLGVETGIDIKKNAEKIGNV